jgi:hypothetical protein
MRSTNPIMASFSHQSDATQLLYTGLAGSATTCVRMMNVHLHTIWHGVCRGVH